MSRLISSNSDQEVMPYMNLSHQFVFSLFKPPWNGRKFQGDKVNLILFPSLHDFCFREVCPGPKLAFDIYCSRHSLTLDDMEELRCYHIWMVRFVVVHTVKVAPCVKVADLINC